MKINPVLVAFTALFAAVGVGALAAQDRSTLKVPEGLAFSDFTGYETWAPVAVSQSETSLKIIAANPAMIRAYSQGLPADGKVFPDGAATVKLEWARKANTQPGGGFVPGELKAVQFMVKDSKKFTKSGGWAYAKFNADSAGVLTPQGTGVDCGHACHTVVAAKDYVFTAYPPR